LVIIINYSHMYSHVVIILTIVIIMVETKNHTWLHDYFWTLIATCPSHKNHILVLCSAYMHWCIMYKCNIQMFTYGGGEWCQNFLFTKLEGKIIIYGMYFCHNMLNLWQCYLILFHLPMGFRPSKELAFNLLFYPIEGVCTYWLNQD
jgi:hypothetical protein